MGKRTNKPSPIEAWWVEVSAAWRERPEAVAVWQREEERRWRRVSWSCRLRATLERVRISFLDAKSCRATFSAEFLHNERRPSQK